MPKFPTRFNKIKLKIFFNFSEDIFITMPMSMSQYASEETKCANKRKQNVLIIKTY